MSKRKVLERIAAALERQAAVMERSDARIEQQLIEIKRQTEERNAAIREMFGNVQVLPGEHPDEAFVLDPDGELDPKKTTH